MIFQGMRAVVIYDPDDGSAVQIGKLVDRSFEFSRAPFDAGETSPTGGRLDQADSSVCRFSFLDSDGSIAQQLDAWRIARKRVSLIAAGFSTCVQWYERDTFRFSRRPLAGTLQGRGDVYDFEISRTGHGRHAIYQQTNLLTHLAGIGGGAWTPDGNIAKGFTSTGAGTLSWLNPDTQQIDHDEPDHGIYADIIFPLQLGGFTIRMTSDIVNLHSEVNAAKLRLVGYDFAGAQILVDNLEFSTTGRKTIKINTSASSALHRIRVFPLLTPANVTITDIVGARQPVLRLDAETGFISN